MRTNIRLGRLFGIEFGLHYSWFIICFLIVLSLAAYFRSTNPQWGDTVVWALAALTGILFFAALLVHEFSHALVAKAQKLPVRSVTLFALGGVAQIEKGATSAKGEFWMGIIGPIVSAVIGAVCLLAASALGWQLSAHNTTPLAAMLGWLGYINLGLAAFNMIPGFPLDGGRVLRAVIWWKTGNENRSTRIAATVGRTIAVIFIVYGLVSFFVTRAGFGGLWLVLIGWFLLQVSRESRAQVDIREQLRGIRVGDIMARDCVTVDGHSNVQTFVEEELLRTGRLCYLVQDNGIVSGLITANEIKDLDQARWPYVTLDDVMRPLDEMRTVSPEMPVIEALELMAKSDINQLPVVSSGHIDGIISRAEVARFFQTRAELHSDLP